MSGARKFFGQLLLAALVVIGLVVLVGVVVLLSRYPARIAIISAIVVVACFVLGVVLRPFSSRVKPGTIIELDLDAAPSEMPPTGIAAFKPGAKPLTLGETIQSLRQAANDKKVEGLILRPHFDFAPRAVIDELRDAIVEFGQSGKFTVAITDSFGEGTDANNNYLLATACKEITVQESGYVGLAQMSMEMGFYPDALARLGVTMEVFGRGKYKSAPNRFTLKKFSEADREQRTRLLESFWDRMAEQISEARQVTPLEVRAWADKGPLSAAEALEAGLVDRVVYPDQATEEVKERVGKKAKLLYLSAYRKRAGKPGPKGKAATVAVIRAAGEIRREQGPPVGLGGMTTIISPESLVPHIRAAVKDKSVKAIVLRIDSPGGSALGSDSLWRELVKAKESGKPLVASMGSVAASGGYYIAAPADKIVAQPTTVTGSIGVFGMRPVVGEAYKKLSIHTDELHTGAEPAASLTRKASRRQSKRINQGLDETYELFMARVAEGRNMARDDVFEVAQGRVWAGTDAVEAGLVDELGGLDKALEVAVGLTDAAPGTKAKIKVFPKKQGMVSTLRKKKGENSEDGAAAASSLSLASLTATYSGVQAHLGFDPRHLWMR